MKKRLVTYLLVSALAAAVFAGCSKKDGGDGADAAATGDAAVVEQAAEVADAAATTSIEDVAAAAEAADADEVAAVAGTTDAVAEADETAAPEEAGVTEIVDDEEEVAAAEETPEEGEYLVVDPGTTYTVRFGGKPTPEIISTLSSVLTISGTRLLITLQAKASSTLDISRFSKHLQAELLSTVRDGL